LMAGINAARAVQGRDAVVLSRTEAYIGIMIDDLITKGTDEPYRMFTSRAEFRLHLRIDNADQRLTPIGQKAGLVNGARWARFERVRKQRDKVRGFLDQHRPRPGDVKSEEIFALLGKSNEGLASLRQLLKRPELKIEHMKGLVEGLVGVNLRDADWKAIETEIKYDGYMAQQKRQIERLKHSESRSIPMEFVYQGIPGLSNEMVEKMERVRPATLGQAARIPGVTPAALSILNLRLSSRERPAVG